jgi:hypothetical protein
MERISDVFFDIGDTLGTVEVSLAGDHIERLVLFPSVADILQRLSDLGARLGIISNRGNVPESDVKRALENTGIYDFFDPVLIIYGAKDSVEIFLEASNKAGHSDSRNQCLFVGENQSERNFAAAAGLRVSTHPNQALNIVRLSNTRRFQPAGFVAGSEAAANPGEGVDTDFDDVLDAIRLHGEELLGFDGVVSVKPGYRFNNGRITDKPAVVVTVLRKQDLAKISAKQLIPRKLGKALVDVVPATPLEQLEYLERQRIASEAGLQRPSGIVDPELPGGIGFDEFSAALTTLLPYKAPDEPLDLFDEEMTVVCHSSPDAGWRNLKQFLSRTEENLTATMYEFNAGYIFQALLDSLASPRKLNLILDGGSSAEVPSPSRGDVSKDHVREGLNEALRERLTFAWAAVADDGKTTKSFFPSAYHIKVAVRDSKSMWLSSGNWKRSGQPEIDPFDPPAGFNPSLFQRSQGNNREWHVIIDHTGLANLFQTFINHDISQALPLQKPAPIPGGLEPLPDLFIPEPPLEIAAAFTETEFFREQPFTKKVRVQPLLTPDNYLEHVQTLIEGAQHKVYFQNQSLSPRASNARYTSLFKALRDKSRDAGIDTRIIVSEFADLGRLQAEGFRMSRVKVQQDCHNKGIIIDDKIVVVGSHNWTGQGATENRDASLIFFDDEIAAYYKKIFIYDWNNLATRENSLMLRMPLVAQLGEPTPPGMLRVSWHDFFTEWRDRTLE